MYREVFKLKGLFLYHSIELMKLNNFCSIMFYYKNLKDKKDITKIKFFEKQNLTSFSDPTAFRR